MRIFTFDRSSIVAPASCEVVVFTPEQRQAGSIVASMDEEARNALLSLTGCTPSARKGKGKKVTVDQTAEQPQPDKTAIEQTPTEPVAEIAA